MIPSSPLHIHKADILSGLRVEQQAQVGCRHRGLGGLVISRLGWVYVYQIGYIMRYVRTFYASMLRRLFGGGCDSDLKPVFVI